MTLEGARVSEAVTNQDLSLAQLFQSGNILLRQPQILFLQQLAWEMPIWDMGISEASWAEQSGAWWIFGGAAIEMK